MGVPVPNGELEPNFTSSGFKFFYNGEPRTHDHEVPTDNHNLVDYSVFNAFHDPNGYPDGASAWYLNGSGWDFHHMLFSRPHYSRHKKTVLSDLRSVIYYQVPLQRDLHNQFHWNHETDVSDGRLDTESAQRFIEEASWLTRYGVGAFNEQDTAARMERKLSNREKIRLSSRLAIFSSMRSEADELVSQTEVIPKGVSNYVVTAYGMYQTDKPLSINQVLSSGAEEELIPVRLEQPKNLRHIGRVALDARLNGMSWPFREIIEVEPTTVAA